MKLFLRKIFWKLLGKNHEKFLINQRRIVYLDDFFEAEIGRNTYNNGAKVWKWNSISKLKIGNFCSVANDVNLILDSGNHDMFSMTTYPLFHNLFKEDESFTYKSKQYTLATLKNSYHKNKNSIIIENEVWIGANVTILPGVKIGNGAQILAGSVVTKSVDNYSIVGGIPAKHINYRFPECYHIDLSKIAWWNWDDLKIKLNVNDFELSIEDFIKKHLK